MLNALQQIVTRNNQVQPDGYINIFAGDDLKKLKPLPSSFIKNENKIEEFQRVIENKDVSSYGVFMTFNPLNKPRRLKENITKLLYIFIDLDDAKEEHNELIKDTLKNYNITFSYNAKSGGGFHFLVPISLETTDIKYIKGFLTYLKSNVCDKVDLATADEGRLIRIPGSFHKKSSPEFQLETLHSKMPKDEEIENNNINIKKYQLIQKKGEKDLDYISKISRDDIFFSEILNDSKNWSKYYKYLNDSSDRNNFFIKNLGIFVKNSKESLTLAEQFLNNWEPARVAALHGWQRKAKENNYTVNYFELLKWSKNNKLKEWEKILEKQTKETFLDDYEIYYLDNEKTENAYLLYYQKSQYFVQKSFQEILNTIYYNCKHSGIDLEKELNLASIYDDWGKMAFSAQIKLLFDQMKRIIDKENRIQIVYNINYEPSENKFFYFSKKKFFNTYNKTDLWDYYKKETKYNFPFIKELILNLCNKNEAYFDWFNKWLAWQIQNPTEKLPTAVIFQGRQGSGKGTFKNLILDNIFGDNCQEINQTHLESNFNEYLLGKQIIVANEVMHNENRQTLPNVLKNYVTDPELTINRKFRKEIVGKNFTHWIFCTNSDNPIKIEADDRRYSVFYSEKIRKGLGKDIRSNLDHELKQYICYLKELKIDFDEVSEPIMTQAKEDIIELNKDSIQRFIEYIQTFSDYKQLYVKVFGNDMDLDYIQSDDGHYYTTTDSFYSIFTRWGEKFKERGIYGKQNFSKKLSPFGIKPQAKWLNNSTKKVYDIFLIENIMKNKEVMINE